MANYPRQEAYESRFTQKVANNFPHWHIIRTSDSSTGFKILNSYGVTLGEMSHDIQINRRNFYLSTADTLVRWEAYRVTIPQTLEYATNSTRNLLNNAHFQFVGMAIRNQPREWEVENVVRYTTRSYKGSSVLLDPEPGEDSYLYQEVDGEFEPGQSLTASIYANDTGNYSGFEYGAPYLALQLSVYTYDGGIATQTTVRELNDVTDWERHEVTLPVTHSGYKARFRAEVVYPDTGETAQSLIRDYVSFFSYGALTEPPDILDTLGAFSYGVFQDGSTLPVTTTWLSAPQLEFGATATEWKPSPLDSLGHSMRVAVDFSTGDYASIELTQTHTMFDLFEDAVPTRAEVLTGQTGDMILNEAGPTFYEWSDEIWETAFRITGDYVQLYNTDINSDDEVITSWSIYDRYILNKVDLDEEYGIFDDVTRTLEALTVYRRRIYLVCKETYNSITKRILKVLDWGGLSDRLQVIHDIDLEYTGDTVDTVGFMDGRIDQLGMELSDGTKLTSQLYYDIFYHDMSNGQVIMRQSYSDGSIRLIEV